MTPGPASPLPTKPPRYRECSSSPRTSPRSGRAPVYDWLVVGRECAGVDEQHRLLIDDPAISRTHLELRLDFERDQAWLTDCSTNGTRLNGQRIERSVPVRIMPGDRVRLGGAELQFRSRRFAAMSGTGALETVRHIAVADMVMVGRRHRRVLEHRRVHRRPRAAGEHRPPVRPAAADPRPGIAARSATTWATRSSRPGRPPPSPMPPGRRWPSRSRPPRRCRGSRRAWTCGIPGAKPLRMGWGVASRAGGGQPADRDARFGARRRDQRGVPAVRNRWPGRPGRTSW